MPMTENQKGSTFGKITSQQTIVQWDHDHDEGFLRSENRAMLLSDDSAAGLLHQFEQYAPPFVEKWA